MDVKRQTERAAISMEDNCKIGLDTEWGQFETVIEEEMREWDPTEVHRELENNEKVKAAIDDMEKIFQSVGLAPIPSNNW